MSKNNFKEKNMGKPVEQHDTAAWANIENTDEVSKVASPSVTQVRNAKEHVDTNEK